MEEIDPLSAFLKGAVLKQKCERYIGFLSSQKGRDKFLSALDHDLARDLVTSLKVDRLSDAEWSSPCVFYSTQGDYGRPVLADVVD